VSDYSVTEAHALWRAGELTIIDVREDDEHAATRVEGVPLIPMSELMARLDEIPADAPLAVLCRSGARSARVADFLTAAGEHGDVANVEGGIIAWAAEGLPYQGEPPR
jgi:rhodanese-related sulfurtransferase